MIKGRKSTEKSLLRVWCHHTVHAAVSELVPIDWIFTSRHVKKQPNWTERAAMLGSGFGPSRQPAPLRPSALSQGCLATVHLAPQIYFQTS